MYSMYCHLTRPLAVLLLFFECLFYGNNKVHRTQRKHYDTYKKYNINNIEKNRLSFDEIVEKKNK